MMSVKKTQQLWKIKSRSLSSHVANEPLAKFADVKQENYQYLQKSPVPTTTFQKSLFRLPIPKVSCFKLSFKLYKLKIEIVQNQLYIYMGMIIKF